MGIDCGPPPNFHPSRAKLPPDTDDDPHVARCITCRQGYTGSAYQDCPQEGNQTICLVPGCRGEVVFI